MASEGSPDRQKQGARRSSGSGNILAAIIAAAATIVAAVLAALIGNSTGVITISAGSHPATTITITPAQARPTVTITESPASTDPGPVTLPNCQISQGCRAFNLAVPLNAGIAFATGSVSTTGNGDLYYSLGSDQQPQLASSGGTYSTAVTSQTAGKSGCQAATTSAPSTNPIVTFQVGLTFCVAVTGGVALVMETRPLGSDNVLYLRELFWTS
jgi:hypothetical protein